MTNLSGIGTKQIMQIMQAGNKEKRTFLVPTPHSNILFLDNDEGPKSMTMKSTLYRCHVPI